MIYYQSGSENTVIGPNDLEYGVYAALVKIWVQGRKFLLFLPILQGFIHRSGDITTLIYNYYKENLKDILPALGTHSPMTQQGAGRNVQRCSRGTFQNSRLEK